MIRDEFLTSLTNRQEGFGEEIEETPKEFDEEGLEGGNEEKSEDFGEEGEFDEDFDEEL